LDFHVSYGLAALAFGSLPHLIKDEAPLARVISADRFHDLGNLLLALVMLWAAYFSQFLLIWSGNLAEEILGSDRIAKRVSCHRLDSLSSRCPLPCCCRGPRSGALQYWLGSLQ
jgi:hypothetical protein